MYWQNLQEICLLKSIDSARFINLSLESLVNNLSNKFTTKSVNIVRNVRIVKNGKECKDGSIEWCEKCNDCKKLSD